MFAFNIDSVDVSDILAEAGVLQIRVEEFAVKFNVVVHVTSRREFAEFFG